MLGTAGLVNVIKIEHDNYDPETGKQRQVYCLSPLTCHRKFFAPLADLGTGEVSANVVCETVPDPAQQVSGPPALLTCKASGPNISAL
jgi:hypothetical protein